MLKKILSTILVVGFASSNVCYAENISLPSVQKPPSEIDVGNAISPMKKGQIAPFTGVLLSPGATATIIAEISSFDERIQIEIDKEVKKSLALCDFQKSELIARCDADRKISDASIEEKTKRIQILDEQVKRLESERTSPYLWTGVGFVGGTVVTVLTVFAVNQLTK